MPGLFVLESAGKAKPGVLNGVAKAVLRCDCYRTPKHTRSRDLSEVSATWYRRGRDGLGQDRRQE